MIHPEKRYGLDPSVLSDRIQTESEELVEII